MHAKTCPSETEGNAVTERQLRANVNLISESVNLCVAILKARLECSFLFH